MRNLNIYKLIRSNLILVFIANSCMLIAQEEINKTIVFKSSDSVQVTADLYIKHKSKNPFIILFHQAGWSRGEYIEIAPKLNELGYNVMAIDQRSGEVVNGIINMTQLDANKKSKQVEYHHAIPDMLAAINYISTNYSKSKIIIWGSSYAAALVLKIAGENPKLADGVVAFSPGEYFEKLGLGKNYITKSAKNISCPVFITSAKAEDVMWKPIYKVINSRKKHYFVPEGKGHHGSRVLWEEKEDHEEYWKAIHLFLKKYF